LLAGAAALLGGSPALADPGGGHGKGHKAKAHGMKYKPASHKAFNGKSWKAKRVWATACPRGLVWRGANCLPPGHAKRLLGVGTRVPGGWSYTPWGRVPYDLRTQYGLNPDYRYIYRDNVIYAVDPRTRLITSIISAVL
jgi:hypothetical protein